MEEQNFLKNRFLLKEEQYHQRRRLSSSSHQDITPLIYVFSKHGV